MRALLILLFLVGSLSAEKLALVIGNSNYGGSAYLANPINDAKLLQQTLEDLKFKVSYYENLTKAQMDEAIYKFSKKVTNNDTALFYYSGHGMQFNHTNYLIPVKAHIAKASQLRSMGVNSNTILDGIINAKLAIILLDACRDNPIGSASKGSTKGLAQPKYTQGNYIISYATEIGEVANDGNGNNSPYALALAHNLKKQKPIETILRNVRKEVRAVTSPQQKPYYEPHIDDEIILNSCEEYKIIPPKFKKCTVHFVTTDSYRYYKYNENGIEKTIKPTFKSITERIKVQDEYFFYNKNYQKIKKPSLYKTIEHKIVAKPVDIQQIPSGVNGTFSEVPEVHKKTNVVRLLFPARLEIKKIPCTQ